MARLTFVVLLLCAVVSASNNQSQTIAAKAATALTGGVTVSDVTLAGNVTAIAGSDTQTGTATLMATATNCSRVDLSLGAGTRTDIQNGSSGIPLGAWNTNNGPLKAHAQHNDWIDASWFFPALTSLVDPSALLIFVGQESRGGTAVYHLRSYRANSASLAQQLSQMDFYLDTSSFLPIAVDFNVHPDDNVSNNIPVEIVYSGYQLSNGVLVPMHIQRYMQGSLMLDVNVTAVTLNSGLSQTEFAVQ
jgi:hypothetical protein